jgi:YD repeat-containing protein
MDEACSRYYAYAYDPVGNRLSQTTQKATTRYAYDAADELQTETAGDKVTLYSYDQNGNETRAGVEFPRFRGHLALPRVRWSLVS